MFFIKCILMLSCFIGITIGKKEEEKPYNFTLNLTVHENNDEVHTSQILKNYVFKARKYTWFVLEMNQDMKFGKKVNFASEADTHVYPHYILHITLPSVKIKNKSIVI